MASGNAGNAWDVSTYTNHSITFVNCSAKDCAGGYFRPAMRAGTCSGFNFQNEIGAYHHPIRPWWTGNFISGTGSIEMIHCSASNLPGAAIQIVQGTFRRTVSTIVTNSFTVRNFTATNVASIWDQPYTSSGPHPLTRRQGFYPITVMHNSDIANGTSVWLDSR
eukprot:SAG31_NODE_16934_length_690_cov_0.700508_1_plen_163_part_01